MSARSSGRGLTLAVLVAATIATPRAARAQSTLQVPLQFEFINPGAKSVALAGAFSGLADDATASFANPAGLVLLGGPELSVELRGSRFVSPFLKGGRLSGEITRVGIDTVPGPVFSDSIDAGVVVPYFSVVYPSRGRRWVVAGYRHELARISLSYAADGVFQQDPSEFTPRRDAPQDATREVAISGYGASGAYRIAQGISVGAALVLYRFHTDSEFSRFFPDGFFGAPDRQALALRTTQESHDTSVAPTVGVTVDRGKVRVGAVYRRGATFSFDTVGDGISTLNSKFRVPHTLAAGASFRTSSGMLVSAEITRVGYARLVRDYVSIQAGAEAASFRVNDVTELHASVQYPLRRQNGPPVRLRVGTWYDPDHSVQFEPAEAPVTVRDRLFDELFSSALSKGTAQVHLTGGVGLTLTPRLEVNAGVDLASRLRLVSMSLILHLGKGL